MKKGIKEFIKVPIIRHEQDESKRYRKIMNIKTN